MVVRLISAACLAIALALVGCAEDGPKPPPAAPTPLALEEWKTLSLSEKYDEGTFDRLKLNDPKLQSDRGWDKFMREVVIPERKKDIPGVPGQ